MHAKWSVSPNTPYFMNRKLKVFPSRRARVMHQLESCAIRTVVIDHIVSDILAAAKDLINELDSFADETAQVL